jgi:acyl-CoA reductase-like NAD-dependent aldehyde dehydrogenase
VPEHRHDEIVSALAEAFAELTVGDPRDPATDVGAMVTRKHYERVLDYLASAQKEGGTFAVGGGRAPGHDVGYYVAPTIITGVSPDAKVAQEEIFGPVLTVLTYQDEEEAVRIANGTEFGLSGAVYSTDTEHALRVAQRINSGTVNLNNGIPSTSASPSAASSSPATAANSAPRAWTPSSTRTSSSSTANPCA